MENITDYIESLNEWRAGAEQSLRSDYSWLALTGLHWLQEGANSAGSGQGKAVRLPERFPEDVGVFDLDDGLVRFTPTGDVNLKLNDSQLHGQSPFVKPDASGEPDFLYLDDLRMMLIERGEQLAMRVWDPQNPVRLFFEGREWFEPNPKFIVSARIEPYQPHKQVLVDDITGIQRPGELHAALHFELDGAFHSLDAELLDSGAYYIIFKDSTAGDSTYGAGRYLVTAVAEGEQVVIDFNRAYNPPCAFTDFATCPLPQPENVLDIEINAGERFKDKG